MWLILHKYEKFFTYTFVSMDKTKEKKCLLSKFYVLNTKYNINM
jgi:hypothetical protein